MPSGKLKIGLARWEFWFFSPKGGVFAFTDFSAWNATVGIDDEWRKLVYRQAAAISNGNLEKIEISKRVFMVYCLSSHRNDYFLCPAEMTEITEIEDSCSSTLRKRRPLAVRLLPQSGTLYQSPLARNTSNLYKSYRIFIPIFVEFDKICAISATKWHSISVAFGE